MVLPHRKEQADPTPQGIAGQSRLRRWLPLDHSPCLSPEEGAPGTYLKAYVPFIPEVLVPFPAMEKENLFKHGACGPRSR